MPSRRVGDTKLPATVMDLMLSQITRLSGTALAAWATSMEAFPVVVTTLVGRSRWTVA